MRFKKVFDEALEEALADRTGTGQSLINPFMSADEVRANSARVAPWH